MCKNKRNKVDVHFENISHTRGASLCCVSLNPVKESKQNPVFSQLSTDSVTSTAEY